MLLVQYPERSDWPELLKRPALQVRDMDAIVRSILETVQKKGDSALINYTEQFDHVRLAGLKVTPEEFHEAEDKVDNDLKEAVAVASRQIELFHRSQLLKSEKIVTSRGVTCWQKAVPIQKVGLYIPGGTAPLFSTVLMLAIPARLAGCAEIILCTPPSRNGKIHPAVLYAAGITGVTAVYKVGGAQAIAAMAYGTETVPAVLKIFGPGNQFVTAAKQLVARHNVAIDMPAGPSELAVIADATARAAFVASDLLSQAEHGADSQVLLFTTSESFARQVQLEVEQQLQQLPRKEIASAALKNSRIFLMHQMHEAIAMVNEYAPEHLIIATEGAEALAESIINAGSVFIGHYTPESAGDYASGTNHTLPTNGFAKAYHGVNMDDYVKKITFQQITRKGLELLGPVIMKMAETEELQAHSNAVSIRLKEEYD